MKFHVYTGDINFIGGYLIPNGDEGDIHTFNYHDDVFTPEKIEAIRNKLFDLYELFDTGTNPDVVIMTETERTDWVESSNGGLDK